MADFVIRRGIEKDIPYLARIRAENSATQEHWMHRITGYLNGIIHPQKAKAERIIFVASLNDNIIGFIAGHLTDRFGCNGELQWVDVLTGHRRSGIASALLQELAAWFITQSCYKICVDPGNDAARHFYSTNGAADLNEHWMYWADIRQIK
jgi:ribosomal protein S18 acetylase RimI-like enzyme